MESGVLQHSIEVRKWVDAFFSCGIICREVSYLGEPLLAKFLPQ